MITPIHSGASISPDKHCRFSLTRLWRCPPECIGGSVLYLGHNPSTADTNANDPTIHRMMDFADRWGYGRIAVGNLIPYRTSNPVGAHVWYSFAKAGLLAPLLVENWEAIERMVEDTSKVVACWGAIARPIMDLQVDMRKFFEKKGIPLYVFGLTQEGFPIHPCARGRNRIPGDVKLQIWSPP
jgi:hypothetical protein